MAEDVDVDPNQVDAPQVPPWLRATEEDLSSVDFERPLAGTKTADCNELSDLYRAAMQSGDDATEMADTPEARVFTLLSAVTGMYFKPHERNEPFGPMVVFADGHRSATPSDFRPRVALLAIMAERALNPVLRARLCDLCWLLERKRWELAIIAIAAYTEIVEKIDRGEMEFRFVKEADALQHDARDYLLRALQIGQAVGWEKPETIAVRNLVKRLRELALARGTLVPVHWFSALDLDFDISDPGEVGKGLDDVLLATKNPEGNRYNVVDLWRLAARAYHLAKRDDDKNRCLSEASEALVAEAEAKKGSAMLASHFLSAAIAQLHGIPGKRERRTALRHKLIDVQAHISEEMSSFSQGIDLREIAEMVQKAVGEGCLLDKLFIFAALENSPEPKKLSDDAVAAIKEHPLSSLFGAGRDAYLLNGEAMHMAREAGDYDRYQFLKAVSGELAARQFGSAAASPINASVRD